MILITGATGRLGRRLVEKMLGTKQFRNKLRVLVTDKDEARRIFGSSVQIHEAELGNPHDFIAISEACRNAGKVVHLAGIVDYAAPEEMMMRINLEGTRQLIAACKLQKRPPKLVFFSSTSIYRGAHSARVDEKTVPHPVNAYGRSKLLAEHEVERSGLDYVILRSPIIYGREFRTGFGDVIRLVRKRRMPIIGSGGNVIQYINVSDAVDAILLALESPAARQSFIISSGESYTQKELFAIIAKEQHVAPPSIHIPKRIAYFGAGIAHSFYALLGKKPKILKEYVHTLAESRVYDISKARKVLHFNPKVKIREGVRELLSKNEWSP